MRLKEIFESYGIDFIDDLDACMYAYDEPATFEKYLQNNESKKNVFKVDLVKANETDTLKLLDIVVDNVRLTNKQNKNWIIVNAPLDSLLVKKLINAGLNPIQMIFFHDTDPMHKLLLYNEISNGDRSKIIWDVFENVKNGVRHETVIEKIRYSEFVNKIENSLSFYDEEYEFSENELEIENENDNGITHEYIMETITPVIIERLNQYTEDLLEQWLAFKNAISYTMDHYMDFSVIKCRPFGSTTDMLKILLEDTLYHMKK